jgi:hypothetical protein
VTIWRVFVFDDITEVLLLELSARAPDRAAVRHEWNLPPRVAIGSLPIEAANLAFVNELLVEPLRVTEGQSAFLEEVSEYPGETVVE